ncbi:hypothetical protein EB796_018382 [Bugula neritina]|uniref:Uncharacterized protein n=1 Tax=Bugula neritina TaxID=10212 RepID=A0A7J7JD61_BUGNE|nr:hypothetical protein EB796_018382 [Bugula neritina]
MSAEEPIIDEIFYVLLSYRHAGWWSSRLFMDNTIPGTAEERGMKRVVIDTKVSSAQEIRENLISYDFPLETKPYTRPNGQAICQLCPNFLSHRRKVVPEQLNGYMNSSTSVDSENTEIGAYFTNIIMCNFVNMF